MAHRKKTVEMQNNSNQNTTVESNPFISIASLTCKYLPKHRKPRNLFDHRRVKTSQIRDPEQLVNYREFLRKT